MLSNNIGAVDYADNPTFADLVLMPLLRLGNHVTIVSGFVPSYVNRTLERLVEQEPPATPVGSFQFVWCLPALEDAQSTMQAVAQHVATSGAREDFAFLSLLERARAKNMEVSLQILVPTRGARITRSAIGLISDGSGDSNRVAFIDELSGDDNSAIHLTRSWVEDELVMTDRFEDLVYGAVHDSWAEVVRLADVDGDALLKLTVTHSFLTQKTERDSDDFGQGADRDASSEPKNLQEKQGDDTDLLDIDVDFLDWRLFDFSSDDEDFFEGRRERLGDRQHASPASAEILEIVGDATYQCWCGNDYSIRWGCTEND
jgi:hypothetical protein